MHRFAVFTILTVILCACSVLDLSAQQAGFSFGIVADVQYADKADQGPRRYAGSIDKLSAAVDDWNKQPLAFIIQLGDIIDGNRTPTTTLDDMNRIQHVFERLSHPLHHVIGNHCLSLGREALLHRLGLQNGYRPFTYGGWRFLLLDNMDISVQGWEPGSRPYAEAESFLKAHPDAKTWNGAIGQEQKTWLLQQLKAADQRHESVMIFAHHPVLPTGRNTETLLWNHDEILSLIETFHCVKAWFSGHDHKGGYGIRDGIHHVTIEGMVESPAGGNAYGVVTMGTDTIHIQGNGALTSRVLHITF